MVVSNLHVRDAERGRALSDYWPLISLVVVSALAAFAIAAGAGNVTMTNVMHAYMGVFLVVFALLKMFDLEGFMNGFAMYDLIAKRNSTWGYVYPFIELALGLAYLAFLWPTATYIATIIVFTFGAVGVGLALRRGLDIACPCMGNVLSVPLSTVTLTEDVLMVAMAIMLLMWILSRARDWGICSMLPRTKPDPIARGYDVRYWHLADMGVDAEHVRSWG